MTTTMDRIIYAARVAAEPQAALREGRIERVRCFAEVAEFDHGVAGAVVAALAEFARYEAVCARQENATRAAIVALRRIAEERGRPLSFVSRECLARAPWNLASAEQALARGDVLVATEWTHEAIRNLRGADFLDRCEAHAELTAACAAAFRAKSLACTDEERVERGAEWRRLLALRCAAERVAGEAAAQVFAEVEASLPMARGFAD